MAISENYRRFNNLNNQNVTNSRSFLQNDMQKIFSFMDQINNFVGKTNDVALDSSLNQAQMALSMALLEAEGLAAQLQMNDFVTALNAQTDLTQLGARNALMLASKSYETSVLIAQFREKTLAMFITLAEQRTNNTWGRIKQLTQGFKF